MINLEESKKRNQERKQKIDFHSQLLHLLDHNGFRKGELHALIGPKGGGKSTLFRTWMGESLVQGKRVYLRLSEEKTLDYQDEIVEQLGRVMPVDGMTTLKIDSELELASDQHGSQYFDDLTIRLKNFKADILFMDNFTTSELSDCNVMVQGQNAKKLRLMAMKLNIPVVVATHTVKGFKSNSVASGDDSRGSMTLINTAAYVYSVNVIFDHPARPTIIFVDKARHHTISNKSYYQAHFDGEYGLYKADKKIKRPDVVKLLKDAT